MGDEGEHERPGGGVASVAGRCVVLAALGSIALAFGRDRLGVALLVASSAWLLIGLVAPAAAPQIDRALARFGSWVGDAISFVISLAVLVLAVLPLAALSKLVRVSPIESGWVSSRSAWISLDGRRGGPEGAARRARRMAAIELRPAPGVRWRNRVRNALGVLVVVGVVALVVNHPWHEEEAPKRPPVKLLAGFPFSDYAFQDEPWAQDLYQDLDRIPLRKDQVLGHTLGDAFESRYVNIADAKRVSYRPEDDPELTVWAFGGSTLFGFGQRDDHTIPSELARLAEQDGLPVEVVNYGVPGYTNWSELQAYTQALTSGAPRPDVVLFYDGMNDFSSAVARLTAGDDDTGRVTYWPLTDEGRAVFQQEIVDPVDIPKSDHPRLLPDLAGRLYGRGVETARMLSESAGIDALFYWQPTLQSKKAQAVDRPIFDQLGAKQSWLPDQRRVYDQIRERSGAEPIDVSRSLDGATTPVLMDWAHTNELGARLIAEAMYETLGPELHRLAEAS